MTLQLTLKSDRLGHRTGAARRLMLVGIVRLLIALLALGQASPWLSAYEFTATTDPTTLLTTLMGPGIRVDETSVEEAPGASAIGVFSQLESELASFSNGVMITTGTGLWGCNYSPTNSAHTWSLFNRGQNHSFNGDGDLEVDFGLSSTYDAASIDLVVVPDFATLNIRYFMASEEYFFDQSNTNDYDVSWYDNTDVFAFYVGATNEASHLTNIALTPEGVPISVRSVNIFTNRHLFTPNLIIDTNEASKGDIITPCASPDIPYGMQYNGIVAPLVATVKVTPGQPYRLKIVVADGPAEPSFVDTAVFLEQFSLTSGTDLRVSVDPVPAGVSVGGSARYDVTVSNIGPVPADNVVVTNWLPAGISATNTVVPEGATSQWFDGDTWMTCSLGTLTNGHSRTLSFHCPFGSAGAYTNMAAVGTSTGDYNPTNNADGGVVWVGASIADLVLVKRGPATACVGTTITYLLSVTNAGPGAATGIALADHLPGGFHSVGPTNWTLAGLAAGETASWSLAAAIAPDAPAGWVTNHAAVAAASSDPAPANNAAEVATRLYIMSDVAVVKTGPASGVAGEPLTYMLTVTNAGPSLAQGVTLNDMPPAGTTAQSPLTYTLGDLSVGASTSLLFMVDVHADTLGWITNRAEVSCGSDSNLVDNVSEVATEIVPVADVAVVKTGPASGTAGEPLTYALTVTNAGPSLARSVALLDTPPAGTTAQSPLSYSLGDLVVGASTSLFFTVDVHADTLGWITNRAEVSCGSDSNLVDNVSEAATLIDAVADLTAIKSGPATGVAGEPLAYTLTVTNAGPSLARGVTLTDMPPAGTTPQSPLTYTLGDLSVGASTSLLFTVDVHPDTLGWITNRVGVSATSLDTNAVNDTDEAVTQIDGYADLAVIKTGPALGVAGEPLTYSLTVVNAGPSIARAVTLDDAPPAGTAPQSPLSRILGDLAVGVSTNLLFMVDVHADTLGWVTNRATVSAASQDTNTVNNVDEAATRIDALADLSVIKTGPATGVAGEPLTYTLVVANAGPSRARGVALSDTSPAGTTPQSPLSYALGDLAVGASTSLLFKADVHTGTLGWITNRAAVTATSLDTNAVNDSAEAATHIDAVADLAVLKTGPATGVAGEPLVYTLAVTNAGPSLARGVVLNDLSPPEATAQSPLTYALGDLDVGAATSLQFTVSVHAATQGSLTNLAMVACVSDTNLVNNSSWVVTLIAPIADVSVIKTGPATGLAGQPLTYTLTVANAGPSLARAVVLGDTPPAGTTAQSPLAYPLGDLAVGVSTSLQFMVDVHADTLGWITNRVAVVCGADTNLVNNASEAATLIAPVSDVSVVKTGPSAGVAGQPLTYTLTVANAGPALARAVVLSDTPSAGTTAQSPLSYPLGDLAVGVSTSLLFAVDVHAGTLGWITNRATVACGTDSNLLDNVSEALTLITSVADVSVVKTGSGTGVAGEPLTYTLSVSNAGPSQARAVVLSDTPPAGTTAQSPLTYALGDLLVGTSTSILFTADVHADTLGWITNRAAVAATSLDTNAVNDSAEAPTRIVGFADLAVFKTGPATGVAGTALPYVLTVSNAGPSVATGLFLSDAIPTGTTALLPTNLVLGALAPGVASNLVFTLRTDPDLLGWITNRVVAVCGADTNNANNTAEAVTLIRDEADLRVVKTASATSVQGGTPLAFTITLTNAGPSVARNVRLEDRQTGDSGSLGWPVAPTNGFDLAWPVLAPGGFQRITVPAETYRVAGLITNRVTVASDAADTNSANNAAQAVVSVMIGTEAMTFSATWTLNYATGLFDVSLALRNTGTLPVANRYFWLALPVTTEWWLQNPTGTLPDAKTFFDLTYRVRTALQATGNRDAVFDPGESVTINGPMIYHRRRVNPRNYVNPATAVQFGRLYSGHDVNRDFRVDAAEIGQVTAGWRSGGRTDDNLLEATRLHRGAAYLWDAALGTWRVLKVDARD